MRFVAFLHSGDKSGFGISFPDFPGCISFGDTVDDAIRHGSQALAFHVEGMFEDGEFAPDESTPDPRSLEAIRNDPELAEWRRGADIVFVPLFQNRGWSQRVNISLDRGLLEAIDDEARRRGMTRSAFLTSAARREIDAT